MFFNSNVIVVDNQIAHLYIIINIYIKYKSHIIPLMLYIDYNAVIIIIVRIYLFFPAEMHLIKKKTMVLMVPIKIMYITTGWIFYERARRFVYLRLGTILLIVINSYVSTFTVLAIVYTHNNNAVRVWISIIVSALCATCLLWCVLLKQINRQPCWTIISMKKFI